MTNAAEPRSIYVVSDAHGHLEPLKSVLDLVDLDGDPGAHLYLLGDYIDRWAASCEVLELVRDTQQRHPARVIALLGNHEAWFLEWLDGEDDDCTWLLADPDFETVRSFLPPRVFADALGNGDGLESTESELDDVTLNRNLKRAILERHADLIDWLRGLPLVHETPEHIFAHAGVDETAGVLWRAATPDHMFTEKYPASTGSFHKTIVAGHVHTAELHGDPDRHSVFFDGESHLYIDGSVEVTGHLNVLRLDPRRPGRYEEFSIGGAD